MSARGYAASTPAREVDQKVNHLETQIRYTALWGTALLLIACGGNETPALNAALTDTIALEYGSGTRTVGSANDRPPSIDPDSDPGGSEPNTPEVDDPSPDDQEPEDSPMMPVPDPEPEPSGGASDCDGFAIVQANCGQGGCHGGSSNLGNFAESEAAARGYIGRNGALTCASAGPIIDPENPSESVLVLKLSDDPPCGNYMPPSGQFLPEDDVECITNWIANLE